MIIDHFLEQMGKAGDKDAIVANGKVVSFHHLLTEYEKMQSWLQEQAIPEGAVVSFDGDYSLEAVALFLVLAANKNIVVPLSSDSKVHFDEFREIAFTEYDISFKDRQWVTTVTGRRADHPHYYEIRKRQGPGLVLFSSGSTGKSKGIVQNLSGLMRKFEVPRRPLRMLIFLQLDHIGGINSLLYTLANGGAMIVPEDRSPSKVCAAIQDFNADLLPTSPTFLNLVLLSKEYENYDLSSLKLITYGTEPMPQSTLKTLAKLFAEVTLQQTYGLSEVGILRSKSRTSDSLWMKVGGEEFTTKIVDSRLWIKSESAMLGYLNAPDPFDEEGFLDTGDLVEQEGEWIKILGRKSEIINVGGFKVFPAEVESVLLEMDNVADVVVFGEQHHITGHIVVAKVKLEEEEALLDFKIRLRQFCNSCLQQYKVPAKIYLTDDSTYNERFKRMRRLQKEWE